MIFGDEDLAEDLRRLGVAPGDGLFVHSALSKVGHVLGGPRGLIQALVNVVGEGGLIAMPGFSRDAYDPSSHLDIDVSPARRAELREQVPGFDPARSHVRQNGAVPETFRRWPGVARSPHPTSSVLLLGADAGDYANEHDPLDWPTGPSSPWGKLAARPNMKILLIGVGWNRCSALHAAESRAPHKRTVMREFKLVEDGRSAWVQAPDVSDDLDTLFPLVGAAWERQGDMKTGRVGLADARLTSYKRLIDFASDWLNRRNQADGVPAA